MSAVHFDTALNETELRRHIYAGDIFILTPSLASLEMIELARQMLDEAFDPFDPRTAHEHMTPEDVASILSQLKPQFVHHPTCKELIREMIADAGFDPAQTYFDVPRLRTAYPADFLKSGIAYAYHPHRDTWYSSPMCQMIWWFPVYSIARDNCMAFYPQYFDRAVGNSSHIYNYYDWNTKHRPDAARHVRSDTREQPRPLEPLEGPAHRYLPPPGGVILFSGAHLHETVHNTSGLVRFSIDFRTVNSEDAADGRGARNVDARCTGTTIRDYVRSTDLAPMPDEIVERYSDGTETEDKVLVFGDRLAGPARDRTARRAFATPGE